MASQGASPLTQTSSEILSLCQFDSESFRQELHCMSAISNLLSSYTPALSGKTGPRAEFMPFRIQLRLTALLLNRFFDGEQ
jgi:hypothetical protein